MACIVARQGRHMQRYNSGRRLVVGCIPYRFKTTSNNPGSIDHDDDRPRLVEILVITSQKGYGMMFPKGGWELDETMTEAASREALEEAGVRGEVEDILGKWKYKSRRYGTFYEGCMFPLRVSEELTSWPEMGARGRRWVTVEEAREGCEHLWMTEALEELDRRLSDNTNASNKESPILVDRLKSKDLACIYNVDR
ncbi:nudix hydrolase 17, mitochondrial-like [Iris pallida]|uniref:Nudix hydrolase 17, mitochondrial-like n=1 Tax=Iris pallida TaxID=29817 RepID=A0AAX6GM32_IRIPA|nr:nudix hydrolase 17, mitochondrial-like [Iris pallida]KAJ6829291.1 nudix hydrolase 17, mitochondrial-like [Iris pallida]